MTDIGEEEVIRRLKHLVRVIQEDKTKSLIRPWYAWWPLNSSAAIREPFQGYGSAMTFSEKIGLNDKKMPAFLKDKRGNILPKKLQLTIPGCFVFREIGTSTCVAITCGPNNEYLWPSQAVPDQNTIVKKNSNYAIKLRDNVTMTPMATRNRPKPVRKLQETSQLKDAGTGKFVRRPVAYSKPTGENKLELQKLLVSLLSMPNRQKALEELESLI